MLRRRSTLERHNLVLQRQIPLKSRVWTQRFIPDTGACRVLPDASLNLEVAVITMLSPPGQSSMLCQNQARRRNVAVNSHAFRTFFHLHRVLRR